MLMTTPNEFLQFAREMGLGSMKPTPLRSLSSTPDQSTATTGLSVLNNLCCLIQQIHQLRAENSRLRAHLELDEQISKFRQRLATTDTSDEKKETMSSTIASIAEKSRPWSPSNSLKLKQSKSTRDPKGTHYRHHQEDSPPLLPTDHEQSELIDTNSGSMSPSPWDKVRHAFRFSLRRKHDSNASPPSPRVDRQVPTISVSIESDDDLSHENKRARNRKKKILTANDSQAATIGEDSDLDDESMQFVRTYHRRRLYGNETPTSSSTDRQEASSTNLQSNVFNTDEESLLTRKQSKMARYRRKLRSKFDIVRRQFSDQNSSTSLRLFHHAHDAPFEGSGLNHALLTAQLAPALTKSYQQKMRDWESMQKSHFLVNYRRQSIAPKPDVNNSSRKTSMVPTQNETSPDATNPSVTTELYPSPIGETNHELESHPAILSPILSANQRALIVHQWRAIMSEEIFLRHCHQYLEQKTRLLQELEGNLKTLKTKIFCTNHCLKPQSMVNIQEGLREERSYLPQRCRSLHTLVSIPASWILAVQSAAYSDVLDGTSDKATERAILFNKHFFDQLELFKRNREKFEQGSIKNVQASSVVKRNQQPASHNNPAPVRLIPVRGYLRKLSLIESAEFPQYFLPDPVIPLQTTISPSSPLSSTEDLVATLVKETKSNSHTSTSSIHGTKRSKRARFDFKESFDHSRGMCVAQINAWLQRRRQAHVSAQRRQSTAEIKAPAPCSTSKLFRSPRLARFHQRIFKQPTSTPPPANPTPTSTPLFDDSDDRSQYDLPVRIYFPPLSAPVMRRMRLIDTSTIVSSNDDEDVEFEQASPLTRSVANRKYPSSSTLSSSSFKITSAKERRESYATLSNIFKHRCL